MELKEYLEIVKKNTLLFLSMVFLTEILGLGYFFWQRNSFNVSLGIGITRSGYQETADYKFDDFYRIQADEKFAETVVGWLKNPRVVADIFAASGADFQKMSLGQLSRKFKAEKVSSQLVSVSFSSQSEILAKKISAALVGELEKNTAGLNENQKEKFWFQIVSQNPVILKNDFNFLALFLGLAFLGAFLGWWIILFAHYLK